MTGKDGKDRVTDRLPGAGPARPARVTDRLPETSDAEPKARVTDRLDTMPRPETAPPPSWRVGPGQIVNGRYRLEEGPLGQDTGEAQVYRCLDRRTSEEVALKLYKPGLSPKPEVVEGLHHLDHPNLVGLRDYGDWEGRFYEVLEFCRGGSLADLAPLSEEKLKRFLSGMIEGLRFCHDQGIVHRDIKPNNFLFRDPGRTQVVIGDFGISSFLPEGRREKKTKTYMFFTVDYCPPEQLRLREVGSAADYYSLGITLIHVLMGTSPFASLDEDEIVDRHLRGQVPRPEGLSEQFSRLLEGLLRQNPQARWGYEQVGQWLRGESIVGRDGRPDREEVFFGAEIKYPECPEATNPALLARRLDKFDAEAELFRGRISLWVNLFDPEMAARIVQIEEDYTDRPRLGLLKLRHTLDPGLPLAIRNREIPDLPGLVAALRSRDKELLEGLKDAFWDGAIETWIATVFPEPPGPELAEKIKSFRIKYKGRRQSGALHLLFILEPAAPLVLGRGLAARTPEEAVEILAKRPEVKEAVKAYLFSGQLAAWIELAFPDRQADADYLNRLTLEYSQDREMGLKALVWYLKPQTPFPLGDKQVMGPKELAALIDSGPEGWALGESLISSSLLRTWLLATGRLEDPAPLDQVVRNEKFSAKVKLDMILRLLDPELGRPEVGVDKARLDFGGLRAGGSKTLEIEFFNKSRGQLSGRLRVSGPAGEIGCDPYKIEGASTLVRVTARPPSWLSPGLVREAVLVAETNGGGLEIPVTYRVTARTDGPPAAPEEETLLDKLGKLFR
ncbi:MAG: serine/threonine-protein kinase [Thermodesulfobacteriota bacterium]